jgi:Zn-dependent protease with chaperone function
LKIPRIVLSFLISILLVFQAPLAEAAAGHAALAQQTPTTQQTPATANSTAPPSLDEVVKQSSWDIAALAEKFDFDSKAISQRKESLRQEMKLREENFKKSSKATEKQIEAQEKELKKLPQETKDPEVREKRRKIRCQILKLRRDFTEMALDFFQRQIASDVEVAKLNLLAEWKKKNAEIEKRIGDRTISKRRFGNVLDIGERGSEKPFRGQGDDVSWGKKEIEEARRQNLLPLTLEDEEATQYVTELANRIARNSDLQVPLKVYLVQEFTRREGKVVVDEKGVPQQVANAMVLPGGYLFLYAGMIEEAENESQLAGVIAHEISHASARHARRLANKARTFNILELVALIGLSVLTPGLFQAASYLGYQLKGLLLQAIFGGLGLVFTVNLLGVSRDFELEADQLGMQYAWKTGYDPHGFVHLFDAMSQKKGYASRTAFFATHPAFGDRILRALEEYKALQPLETERNYVVNTSEFDRVKAHLMEVLQRDYEKKKGKKEAEAPTLLKRDEISPEECPELQKPPETPPKTEPKPPAARLSQRVDAFAVARQEAGQCAAWRNTAARP